MKPETVLQFSHVAHAARAILLILVVISLALVLVSKLRHSDEAAPIGGTGRPAPGHSFLGPVSV
jgi:hypothetical protein